MGTLFNQGYPPTSPDPYSYRAAAAATSGGYSGWPESHNSFNSFMNGKNNFNYHNWRQQQREVCFIPPTQIYPYIFVCLAPLYIYAILYLLCLSVFCITGRKIATYSKVKKYFSLFSAQREMPRFYFSNMYVRVPLTPRLQTKIYTTSFVKEQKIYPLFNKTKCFRLVLISHSEPKSEVQSREQHIYDG